MAFTTSDNFTYIYVGLYQSHPGQLRARAINTNGDYFSYAFGRGSQPTPEIGTQEHTDWEILKETWALNNGFLDENGDLLTIIVVGNVFGTIFTPEEHEAAGFYNPFREGSYEKYIGKLQIDGAFAADGSLERDTTTGHPTIGFEGEIEVKGRRPAGTNFTAALSSWTLGYSDADIFRFRLEIPSTEAITEDELDTYTPIRAMLAWLESHRTAGTAIGTDASDPATILGGGRQFTFAQASGDSDIVADYDFHWVITDADDTNVLLYIISLERVSGAVIDATKLSGLLLDTTISIENTSEVKEPGRTGGLESIVQAKVLDMGAWQMKPTRSGVIIEGVDFDNTKFSHVLIPERTVNFDILPADGSDKTIPQVWNFDTIHYTGSGTRVLNLPNPSELIAQQGTHRILALHNIGTGTMIVNDWNDDYLVVLSPTDYVKFQITLEGEGSGGTILGIPAPERRFEFAYSSSSLGSSVAFNTVPYWQTGTRVLRMMPFLTSGLQYRNIDAFALNAVNYSQTDEGDIDDEDDFAFYGVMQSKYKATVVIELSMRIRTDNGATGQIASNNSLRLYRIPANGDNPIVEIEDIGFVISGSNASAYYTISHSVRLDADDRLMPAFQHRTDNLTLNSFGRLKLTDAIWNMTTTPHIERRWVN